MNYWKLKIYRVLHVEVRKMNRQEQDIYVPDVSYVSMCLN